MKTFSEAEHETWRRLFARLDHCRREQAHPTFVDGLAALGIDGERVPDLERVNARLSALTGFRGVEVAGLEDGASFFAMLARREFPIGAFIRDARDLSYTPAPDVFHDMYGHLPLLADRAYADFCQRFGAVAAAYATTPERLRELERVFWFGVEFPLIDTPRGRRIFGGGILSSFGESNYALSGEPEVLPFDVAFVRRQEYRIDEMQRRLFVIDRPEALYGCLAPFERAAA
ncbi:MAG: phenylalanine 4-monooxygenase [Deltaproteobacteria bacterium]|nr:phenylalanine 4-monooxygenase [Deltaproteobacteria bacterium]